MKKHLFSLFLLAGSILAINNASAQVKVNVNIGAQPAWGPIGYDRVDYYYMPDYDVYYNVPRKQFVYLNGSAWAFGAALPARYGTVNLYNTYKVVVNEPRPYLRHDVYKVKYAKYKGWNGERQVIIRDSKDERYFKGNSNHAGNNGKRKGHKGKHKDRD